MLNIIAGVPTDSSQGCFAGHRTGNNSETTNYVVFPSSASWIMSRAFYPPLNDPPLPPVESDSITELPGAKFDLIEQIPVRMEKCEDGTWVANFDEAGIGMPGDDPTDAKDALAENIAYAMEVFLSEEEKLSLNLARELAVLRRYIRVVDDHTT